MKTEKNTSGGRKHPHLLVFALAAAVVFVLGSCAYLYFLPTLMYNGYEQGIVHDGLGSGSPIPLNTLYTAGWLDLKERALVLHVPDMHGRYYSIQFTDPATGSDFAYGGRRTTGTVAGAYLVTGPGWSGSVPPGMKRISSPDNSVLVIGRVLVENGLDLSTAYDLSKQMTLTPLKPGA